MRKAFLIFLGLLLAFEAQAITKKVLPNGMTLIIKESPGLNLVATSVFIKVSNPAFSNLTGNLLLKGTKSRSAEQIADEIENVGGSIAVTSAQDYLELSTLTLRRHFAVGLGLLADLVQNASFVPDEFLKEYNLALSAIKGREDDPASFVHEHLLSELYGDHPYSSSCLGKLSVVQKIKREQVINFYNRYYIPENMVVAVVGDIKAGQVLAEAERTLGQFTRKGKIKEIPPPRTLIESKTKIIPKELSSVWLELGFMVPEIGDKDYAALKVLNSLLGEGMTSHLFTEVRGKGSLVYQIGSFYPSLRQKSHFVVYAATTPKNLKKVKAEILAALEKIKKEPISKKELEHYKSHLIGTFLTAHQSIARQAWYLGWYETIGAGYKFDNKYLELVSKVTPADVQRVARKYFNKYVLVILGP